MRSTYFLGFFVVGAVAAMATGCGGDDSGEGGSGGATTTTTTPTTTTTTTTTTTSAGPDEPNDTIEQATEFTFGENREDLTLDPPASDQDYFVFEGTAQQQVLIQVDSKPSDKEFDPTYPDTVITLYDEAGNQIAQNDDPTPRFSNDSELWTVLPADGRYFLRVTECNVVYPQGCGDVNSVANLGYSVYIGGINPDILLSEDPSGTTAVTYMSGANGYQLTVGIGGFTVDAETDAYTFTVPADIVADAGNRPVSLFSFFPSGPDGSGSSADIQLATLTDLSAVPPAIVAEVNPALGGDLLPPLTPGNDYRLDIKHETGAVGGNPFYYFWHLVEATSNAVEAESLDGGLPNSNNDSASAQELTAVPDGTSTVYRIEGDINLLGDIDYFSFAIPAGVDQFSVFCDAQRSGSGLRDFTFAVVDDANAAVTGGTATEAEDIPAQVTEVGLPAGETTLYLRLSAGLQDVNVTGNYYRCGLVVYPAAQ